jgi:hypothetical protein
MARKPKIKPVNRSLSTDKKRSADRCGEGQYTEGHPPSLVAGGPINKTVVGDSVSEKIPTDDTALFERARMQWHFGDWESLAAIDWESIERHPQRAQLALLTSTAHQQLGNTANARRHAFQARDWGCDKRQLAQVLISCVHNTLARVAATRGEGQRALHHFSQAVEGVGGDSRLACQARSVREATRLNLLDQAALMIRSQEHSNTGTFSGKPLLELPSTPSVLDESEDALTGTFHAVSTQEAINLDRCVIVIAGMRHSGSTALFNLVRLALEHKGVQFTSLYSEGQNSESINDPSQGTLLIKTHELRDDVITRADVVLTTRRDLRDTVASAKRREFPLLKRLGDASEYAKYNRALHDIWLPYSDYEFVYESYMANPLVEARRLLTFIGIGGVDVEAIHESLSSLPTDQYGTTLLSPLHVTDPLHVMSFRDTLNENQLSRINTDNAGWLQRYGYEPTTVMP